MLTDSEKQWLEQRDAMQFLTGTYIADFAEYPLWNTGKDWQDAAEFEARVAAKLAEMHQHIQSWGGVCDECPAYDECSDTPCCKSKFLKYARLTVEEEMENE